MIEFIKNRILILIALLFFSFYISFMLTVGLQIISVHSSLIEQKIVTNIKFGILTFTTCALVPMFLWKIVADSKLPILKETLGIRLILSELAVVFTICLFISKSIYNSIAAPVMTFESEAILDVNGKIVLIEILSIAIPFILFLYMSKKVIQHFIRKYKE